MNTNCTVPGCSRSHYGHGYCQLHYGRWRKHGDPTKVAFRRTEHGMSHSPEYVVWASMLSRTRYPSHGSFANYGAKGIGVCDRWQEFVHFFADMGPRPSPAHSIERVDNDRGYEPDNCRWATLQEQRRNMRQNRHITVDGVTRIATDWARDFGINPNTFLSRLDHGWEIHRALSAPVRKRAPSRRRLAA